MLSFCTILQMGQHFSLLRKVNKKNLKTWIKSNRNCKTTQQTLKKKVKFERIILTLHFLSELKTNIFVFILFC